MKFTEKQLKELAVEPSWLKRYSITTGKMVLSLKRFDRKNPPKPYINPLQKADYKIVTDTGIVYKDELTAMRKSN